MKEESEVMKLVCIGSGYVGSVTGTAFATLGHHVTLVDTNPAKVKDINDGSPPVYEPGLKRLLQACSALGSLMLSWPAKAH